jgi:hypothetical protein
MQGITFRARKDLVTNSAFEELVAEIQEMERIETQRLTFDAKEGDIQKVNVQAGQVEGIRKVLKRIENYRKQAIEDERTADSSGQTS